MPSKRPRAKWKRQGLNRFTQRQRPGATGEMIPVPTNPFHPTALIGEELELFQVRHVNLWVGAEVVPEAGGASFHGADHEKCRLKRPGWTRPVWHWHCDTLPRRLAVVCPRDETDDRQAWTGH